MPISRTPKALTRPRRSPARRSLRLRALLRAAATWSSASRTCTAATTTTSSAWSGSSRCSSTRCAGEPMTVYGQEKTLDFTYVDDCVDGIVAGIEALAERPGHQPDDQPRLRAGQHAGAYGRTDRRGARHQAADDGRAGALGEVTHYIADISRARQLLGYDPQVPLDEGIARAVAWFHEHRAAHPEEDVPVTADHEGEPGRCRAWLEDCPRPRTLLARKSSARRRRASLPSPRRSPSRSRPSSSRPTRCRSIAACRSSRTSIRCAASRHLAARPAGQRRRVPGVAHARSTTSSPWAKRGRRRRLRALVPGRADRHCLPPDVPADARARWERLYDRRGADTAHGLLQAP